MKLIPKDKKKIIIVSAIIVLIAVLSTLVVKHVDKRQANLNPEIIRSMEYERAAEDSRADPNGFVEFSAFFTRDLDGDGNAEKLLGTCRNVNGRDQLYIDINVLTNGQLKDGAITIDSNNFKYSMSMVKDEVLKNNYISDDVKRIELKDMNAGTQKLIIGDVLAYIGNDTNNYSRVNSITLTGTHVSDEGVETKINKTIDLIVDWHGETKASIRAYSAYYNYDDLDTETISFSFSLNETQGELLLKDSEAKVTIPELNGFEPTEVKCTNSNIESEYYSETKELIIKRSSTCNDKGIITSTLSRSNSYTVEVTYPKEAYEAIESYTTLKIPVEGYYVGYNNKNEEFTNPYKSNIAKTDISLIFREPPKGEIYNFYVEFEDKKFNRHVGWVISKQDILDLYDNYNEDDIDNAEDNEENDNKINNKEYVVRWRAVRGPEGEVPSMIMNETKESSNENAPYGDKWSDTIMQEYVTNTGIYFENADQILEEDGTISVYNNDTNELIHTFTKEEWNRYTRRSPYKYENSIRHIRVETSKTKLNSSLSVYHIKELETEKVLKDFTKEQVKDAEIIYTHLTGICNIVGQNQGIANRIDSMRFISEKSEATISLGTQKLSTQEILNNQKIYINTIYNNEGDAKWKNGEFLVELPQEIINIDVKSVSADSNNVKIVAYDLYKKEDKYFIKIITENENPESYRITIDCTMTPDPRAATSDKQLRLYSYNEFCNEYYSEIKDEYDVDSDNNTSEKVGTSVTNIQLLSPTSLITLETITDYDNTQEDETTIAPNIAEVTKETREATINVSLTNNYPNIVSGVQILGKIPFKSNTYILNKNELGSDFTTTMKSEGIILPNELEGKAMVYYSKNENPNKNLEDAKNGWTLKENVQDFSKVKTYLIDLGQNIIGVGKSYAFNYTINIPEGIDYNSVSYSDHAVYYELDTEGGKLQLNTEPNKVGLRVVRKYNLQLTKTKEGFENLKVPNATYKIEYADFEGNERARILTTNVNGNINMEDLYVGITYKIAEIRSPENYVLSDKMIEFKVVEDEQGILQVETTNGREVTLDEQREKVLVKTGDKPKYRITITKTDANTGESIQGVRFRINGQVYMTNRLGQITIKGLLQNKEYTLVEEEAEGYYVVKENITFKLVEDESGNFKIVSNNGAFRDARIQNTDAEDLIKIDNINITNEKIPTYELEILKVEENLKEEDITKLTPLKGARFKLTHEDLYIEREYYTDENGNINIPNLYQYVEGKDLTGKYILQELEAPNGYANDMEEIKFKVMTTEEDKLKIEIEDKESLKTIKDIQIEESTIKIIIQDAALFKLTKTDSKTGEPLSNAKFIIYELNQEYEEIDFAKNVNGNYVGELNEEKQYVVTTDETGTVVLPLGSGIYKAVEIGYPEGYQKNRTEQYFELAGGSAEAVEPIFYIEDLVRLSNSAEGGNNYSKTTIKLMKTLDFTDITSYKDPNDTSLGDLNGDGKIEGIKLELTNRSTGHGFTPIESFSGVFDGQNNEIRNLYINLDGNSKKSSAGLFSGIENAEIKNVGVTGTIIGANGQGSSSGPSSNGAGGIVGSARDSYISNCYNKCSVTINSSNTTHTFVGGIVGHADKSSIVNCYNTGTITCYKNSDGASAGGIVGNSTFLGLGYGTSYCRINNTYNTGYINSGGYAGGIIGKGDYTITNSYNIGNVRGYNYAGGIAGNVVNISNCYYSSNISVSAQSTNMAGITSNEYMKTEEFIGTLGKNFWSADIQNKNNGYPILKCTSELVEYIDCVEDLVMLSKSVTRANQYKNRIVKLRRSLDFEDNSSYNYPDDTSFGDLNGDGEVHGIKQELTDRVHGCGFTPIGKVGNSGYISEYGFSGTFDGQGNEIRNLYINSTGTSCVGLFGSLSGGTIKNLGVIGEISSSYSAGYAYTGGIAGYVDGSISNCYNIGGISSSVSSNGYTGGIAGYVYGSISNCYNIGGISSSVSSNGYTGGIVGYVYSGSINNCYNMGEISSSNSISYKYYYDYTGGIAGYVSGSISNCYNIGGISSSSSAGSSYAGEIAGNSGDISNCYYLNTINIKGTHTTKNGEAISERDMLSEKFYNMLNKDGVWLFKQNSYPKLDMRLSITEGTIKEVMNLNVKNTLKEYNITTEIAPNSHNIRSGGSITGSYTDNYTRENNIRYVETITYNNNSKRKIEIKPQSGYRIDKIYINNKELNFTIDENGNVIIPIGYFTNVKEDYHIAVKFEEYPNLIIHKVDEDDPNIKIPNVKFKLEYKVNKDPNTLIGDLFSVSTYGFSKISGKYVSDNTNKHNTTANAYFPIDLTGQTGTFTLNVNASVSSESNYDFGYATITTTTDVPAYNEDSNDINTKERFIYISGTQNNYSSSVNLIGGKKYYLHIGYRKDGSNNTNSDTFTINSVSLSGDAIDTEVAEVETDSNGEAKAGVPINTNIKVTELNTPKGYIPLTEPIEDIRVSGSGITEKTITNKRVDNEIIINKVDKSTNKPIQGVKFVIYNVDEENKQVGFAKDYNDNYLGTQEGDKYVLTTDENGQINVRPKPGMYKAVEIESAEGYVLDDNEIFRATYFKITDPGINYDIEVDDREIKSGSTDLVINSVEDLMRFQMKVNSGNSYEGKTIKLARTLDFYDDDSFDNPDDTSLGDINGNGTIQRIKQEVAGQGYGFDPIGKNSSTPFKGTFDGNGYEIKNMNNYHRRGLFGYVKGGKILSLGLTGGGLWSDENKGALAYNIEDGVIDNCYNNILCTGGENAGIVHTATRSTIRNCYNTGEINNSNAILGGIVANVKDSTIINCYNTGTMTGGGKELGGIAYNAENSRIINCHNAGNINSPSGCAGIVVNAKNSTIKGCYNTSNIPGTGNYCVGIALRAESSNIENCYNTGEISAPGGAYGIARDVTSGSIISNCYNTGDLPGTGAGCAGIAYNLNNSRIVNCYNMGNITTAPGGAYGIVQDVTSESIISNCYNSGELKGPGNAGGIAYRISNSKVTNCYNSGLIENENIAGGLACDISNSKIKNCYNIGNVEAKNPAGGLTFTISNSEVSNFYNTGIITSYEAGLNGGMVGYTVENSKFTNCYYLNSTAPKGIYNQNDIKGVVESKTEGEMKSEEFVELLNNNRNNIKSDIGLFSWKFHQSSYPEMVGIKAEKSVIVTNSRESKVIVHHYLDGTGPEYGTDPVTFEEAPDEVLIGKEGDTYTTSPNMEINGYSLAKGEDGEYKVPENASGNYPIGKYENGTYVEGETHVYYYYNKNKVNLTVHHYIEGTENKVLLGQDEQGNDRFAEDEYSEYDEGEHYKTTPSEEVLKSYELVSVVGDEEKDITQNEEVIYYYKVKKYEITTRVEVPEGRDEEDKGGQILGEDEKPYEIVDYDESSVKDIIITPEQGYRIKQIRLVSKEENGENKELVIYGENEVRDAEITYEENLDGTITITKFQNMKADKELIVVFEPDEGRLIVHHYIENTQQKIYDDQITIKPVGTKVETKPVKVGNYVLVEGPADRNATITKETQEKTYYYQEQYKITTEVIKHSEDYKDGTTKNNIAGGKIEDEGKESHELVLKNRPNQEEVEINPNLGYEVVEITIKDGKDAEEGIKLDFEQYKEKDANGRATGKIILPKGLFQSMQSDKHIQVEFRKKTNVIVKHLEVGTEDVLYKTEQGNDYEELTGYEGQEFETSRKVIPNYMAAEIEIIESTSESEEHVSKAGVTNENKEHMTKYNKVQTDEETYVNGETYADTLTIIYWYTRVPSGIIVRHIETNEKAEEKELESKLVDGLAGLEQPTTRNKYDKYIPVDRKEENKGNTNENVTIMSKDQDSKTLTFAEDKTLEVWYFYEKQYDVTTEVKLHEEQVVNPETGETATKQVAGGTISKKYEKDEQGNDKLDDKGNKIETVYEKILSRGDSKEEIEIKPDSGYRIKAVTKQKKIVVDGKETYEDEQVFIENMIKEDGSLVLGESKQGEGEQEERNSYLTDVQNDYNIVVEFERIPAKIIVQYKDAYTKETIHEDKEVPGFVNEEYSTTRKEIEGYITAEVTAVKDGSEVKASVTYNAEGNENTAYIETEKHYMTKDVVTITYWYTKQFKITAEVKSHEEEEQNPETGESVKVQKDGGKIEIGENLPEEIVIRGEDSIQKIIATPEDGYQIKLITINGTEIEISRLLKEDGTLELPLFKDMQEDKHVEVEFERIPAKVIVRYLDVETKEPIVDDETMDGYVNNDYETEPKDLKYYEFVEEKYPENDKGTMTKEDIIVKYYYRKLKFNMKIEKEIQSIKVNGQEAGIDLQNNKHAKLEVEYSKIEDTNIEVSYKIKVTNTEKISGTATLEEQVPEEFEFVRAGSDENWLSRSEFEEKFIENYTESQKSNWPSGNETIYMLRTKELEPGETAEYGVTLRWKAKNSSKGEKVNIAKIAGTENEPNYEETTLDDNEDKAIVEIKVNRTIQDIIDDIKNGKTDDIILGIKTGDIIIIFVILMITAGITMIVTIKARSLNAKKESKKIRLVKNNKHKK